MFLVSVGFSNSRICNIYFIEFRTIMDHVFQDLCKGSQINLFYTFSTCPAKVRRLRQMLRPAREAKMHLIHRDLCNFGK